MKITVIGTGYVGLVSGAIFADWGHEVVCLDIDEAKVAKINSGKSPIYEPGLEEVLAKVLANGKFTATTNYDHAVKHGELIFICVGTPSYHDGTMKMDYVWQVAESIGKIFEESDGHKIIITKSTVPVGTTKRVREIINEKAGNKKLSFDIAFNPEFLKEGTAVKDSFNPTRTVLGVENEKTGKRVSELYQHLNSQIVLMSVESAELTKYAANAFLSTKISYINEVAMLCERLGADSREVALGIGLDPRIGDKFLNMGMGWGGSCFPKDTRAFYRMGMQNGVELSVVKSAIKANEGMLLHVFRKITKKYGENLNGKTFGVLGASFKRDTDDVRESTAIGLMRLLRGAGAKIKLYDPQALENAKTELGETAIEYCDSHEKVFDGVDALAILSPWGLFAEYDYQKLIKGVKDQVIFDAYNVLEPAFAKNLGVEYYAIGRFGAK